VKRAEKNTTVACISGKNSSLELEDRKLSL